LIQLAQIAGAEVVGVGALIEKSFEEGREHLEAMGIHVESLARIKSMSEEGIIFHRP
jgi:xanthine phosphoribosyltransferase